MLSGVAGLFFYFFSFVLLISALMVISSRNPVHSVLYLILVFFNASALFLLIGSEFLAMILLLVYVGAVAILFLFVIMMLDIDFAEIKKNGSKYFSMSLFVGLILIGELILIFLQYPLAARKESLVPMPSLSIRNNTAAIGDVLYTHYFYFFQISALILLVAMIGAVVLTLGKKSSVKRQDISLQVARTKETSIEIKKVESGKGL